MGKLTHFDTEGRAVMVDVSDKGDTSRRAIAHGFISMNQRAFEAVQAGTVQKGDVLGVAQVAGIMGVKRTPDLIPLCHPLQTDNAQVKFVLHPETQRVEAVCEVCCSGKTGVEMEALCGVNVALLTIYDMCKAVDKSMVLHDICLLRKEGGKSGVYQRSTEC